MKTQEPCCENKHRHHHGFRFGYLLIIVGIVLLFSKLHVFSSEYASLILSWQMLLIVIGIYKFFGKRIIPAFTTLSIGLFFIVPKIAALPDSFIQGLPDNYVGTYWPVLLIIAGIHVFLHRKYKPHTGCHSHGFHHPHNHKKDMWENNNGYIYKNSAFQSSEHIILDPEFKGGEINSKFGEITIDLRKTQLVEGTSVLQVEVAFGAITIYVPEDWYVQPQTEAIFGSFEDKRYGKTFDSNVSKTLIIKGKIVFGSGELRN
jgi:predicted membrane protein